MQEAAFLTKDIDLDFQSDRRQEVKDYLEKRYGNHAPERVFSAGTFTTEKVKSAMKDIAAIHKVPRGTTNYVTAIVNDDNISWTGLMKLSLKEKKIYDFVQKYPNVFEEMYPLLDQPRSAGIHASAIICAPATVKGKAVECFEVIPMRKQNGMLVSELSGYDLDAASFVKCDVLAIAELSRIKETLNIIKQEYGKNHKILELIDSEHLKDVAVYKTIANGYTQGVFQLSSPGMTKFIKQLKPDNIHDVIAANALFRPATIESGSVQKFIDLKTGVAEPEYLWGCRDALKNTMGVLCYQEQITQIARDVGGFSLADGVKLVKFISKKKIDKIVAQKGKFMAGAKERGCPKEAAEEIWKLFEVAGKYSFNSSHATAYALTSFVGAWLKTHYPVAFYTVQLKWVDDDKLPILMNEMEDLEGVSLVQPNINISTENFETDYKTGTIYWSLARIKNCGLSSIRPIVKEREMNGKYLSLRNFIERLFKKKLKQMKYKSFSDIDPAEIAQKAPVSSRHVKLLIMAGAFDEIEHIKSPIQRYALLKGAAKMLGFTISEKEVNEELRNKLSYWQQRQIDLTGFGEIDYDKIIMESLEVPGNVKGMKHLNLKSLSNNFLLPERYVLCASIVEVINKSYKDKQTGETKHFGKIQVKQNNHLGQILIWASAWDDCKHNFIGKEGQTFIAVCRTEWSEFDEKNIIKINNNAFVTNPE